MKISTLTLLSALLLFAMAGTTPAQLVNGNFETGNFTGWVLYTTPDGGLGDAQVVQFDTADTGTPSFSARFEVGQTSGQIGGGPAQGGGILQDVTLGSGQLTINVDIAAYSNDEVNNDGGTFNLLLDGSVVSSFACGRIGIIGTYGAIPQTIRSNLSYSGTVEAGTHEIAIEIIRVGGNLAGVTPYEYLDNIVLSGTAVAPLPTLSCPEPQTVECGTPATVTAQVGESDGAALGVVWALNGTIVQTNDIPAGPAPTMTNVSFTAELPLGTNLIEIVAANSLSNIAYCSTTVTVVDTTPPVIQGASTSPNILWPPNHKMVTVPVNATVTDNCSPASWKIISVQSNEPVNGLGDGNTSPDWQILGDHTVALRAERSGTGSGRIYTLTLQAEDASGNLSTPGTVTVMVPKSMGK